MKKAIITAVCTFLVYSSTFAQLKIQDTNLDCEKVKGIITVMKKPEYIKITDSGNEKFVFGASTVAGIILPYAIKCLTGNVEVIQMLNRLGHSISYSQMAEIDTALAWKKIAHLPEEGVPLPESMVQKISTTLAFDNIDRLEETLSGAGTSHRVNGIIIQPRIQQDAVRALPQEQAVYLN